MRGSNRWIGQKVVAASFVVLLQAGVEGARAAAPPAGDADLATILAAFDAAQKRTTSIVAEFTEEKRLRLLAKPVVARGTFTFRRPNQVRWEYETPERRLYVITEAQYVAYVPSQQRAEEVPISKFVGKRLFRFIGLGQSISDLGTYYDFRLDLASDIAGTHLLVLTPKKKRVQEKVSEIRIWVDAATSLPRQFRYLDADGDSTTLTFRESRQNVELAAGAFEVRIPAGVAVSNTFNGFALGGGAF